MNLNNLKIAVIHDWLVISGGAEKVLEQILLCFPQSHVYSIVDFLPEKQRKILGNSRIFSSFIQHLPLAKRYYWYYLPLMPLAIEQFDLSEYDLIISSSHAVAKGVITHPHQLHISYVHSPIRFAWDLQNYYLESFGWQYGIKGLLARILFHYLRLWDCRTAHGVDIFIANSHFVARRIKKNYGYESNVIYPPVDVDQFNLCDSKKDFYLTASFMNPFKKIDLIVKAFSKLPHRKLVVIGEGPDFHKIQSNATSNIQFLGYQETNNLKYYMQQAKAFIFAAPEDFGIIMVEAQACGTAVIAYGRGGATEIVRGIDMEHPTGILFLQQTVSSIIQAIEQFEESCNMISPEACRQNAVRFGKNFFQEQFKSIVCEEWIRFSSKM